MSRTGDAEVVKCANCDKRARYLDSSPGMLPVYYCAIDLPSFLQAQADGGQLDIPADPEDRPEVDEGVLENRRARRKST